MRHIYVAAALFAALALATPAFADDYAGSRDIQTAVDSYLSTSEDASLVGGTGSAGYDAGFWIRGGDFLLRINATIQARFESYNYDDEDLAEDFNGDPFAGDLSGFSLPRMTLKLSGEAPCNICWYAELEFGHYGADVRDDIFDGDFEINPQSNAQGQNPNLGPSLLFQSYNFDVLREAWIEWCYCPAFNVRMGQVGLPTARQLMTAPELQQFVDISLASSWTGWWLPGYTTRNRDHGLLFHGAFGCNNEWSWMASVTNGDGGDSVRNVLDHRTSDNLAYGARINWAFLAPIGYEEGALRQQTCQWYGEAGAWAFVYGDRIDKGHEKIADFSKFGVDLALGWGGFSFTGAYTMSTAEPGLTALDDITSTTWLAQIGYHFPGTAWELVARADGYTLDVGGSDGEATAMEYAFGVNYYLNGHANKLQLDASFISTKDNTVLWYDFGAGYNPLFSDEEAKAVMLRFQWQLAL